MITETISSPDKINNRTEMKDISLGNLKTDQYSICCLDNKRNIIFRQGSAWRQSQVNQA